MRRKYIKHYGIASLVDKGRHIPMFDLDKANLKHVVQLALRLQAKYKLGNAYVIVSSPKNYHLMFTDILKFDDWVKVQLEGMPKERKHLGWAFLRGYAVLRNTPKNGYVPYLLKVIKNKTNRKQSYMHQAFIATFFKGSGLPLPKKKYDLVFHSYETW